MGNGTKGPVTATAAGIKQVLAKLSGIQNLIEQERSTYSVSEFEVIQGYAKMVEDRLSTVESSIRTISQAGLSFVKGGKVNEALNSVATLMDKLAGNAKLGADAVVALSRGMEQFPLMAETSALYAESLAAQAASLDRLGISFAQYTKNVDIAQNMFNMTKEQVLGLNEGLKTFADDLKMLPSTVSQNFQLVAKSLSYEAPKVLEQFQKMQTMSQQTGVSVGSLMSGFGERLDTMSGAAQFVGQLNAILGTNAFSPNEILMMDESERMVRIREVIRNHPIYDDIMSGDKLGKFALNTLSKVVGFSKEDTRKYLSGNMDAKTARSIAGDDVAVTTKTREARGTKTQLMTGSVNQIETALSKFTEENIKAGLSQQKFFDKLLERTNLMKTVFLSREDAARAGERGRMIGLTGELGLDRSKTGFDIFTQADQAGATDAQREQAGQFMMDLAAKSVVQFGVGGQETLDDLLERLKKAGGFKNIQDTDTARETFLRASFRFPQLSRLMQTFQTLPSGKRSESFAKTLAELIELAGGAEQIQTQKDMEDFSKKLKAAEGPGMSLAFREGDDQVTSFEARILAATRKSVGPETMGIYRFLLRKFREKDITDETSLNEMFKDMDLNDKDRATFDKIIEQSKGKKPASDSKSTTAPSRGFFRRAADALFGPDTSSPDGPVEGDDQGAGGLPGAPIPGDFSSIINHLIQSGGIRLLLQVDKNTAREITATAFDGQ